jgi:hypothetical protein
MIKTSKDYYDAVLKTGMFFEWYPSLTGDWEIDEVKWKFIQENQFVPDEPVITVEINRAPSFTEVWHEGFVSMDDKKYMFWIVNPTGKDEKGLEYDVEIRWWFKQVPREIRAMSEQIIENFKTKQNDTRTKQNRSSL